METNHNLENLIPEQIKPLYPLEEKILEAAPLGHMFSISIMNHQL